MFRAGVGAGIRWGSGQGVCGGRGGLPSDQLRFGRHVGSSPSRRLWLAASPRAGGPAAGSLCLFALPEWRFHSFDGRLLGSRPSEQHTIAVSTSTAFSFGGCELQSSGRPRSTPASDRRLIASRARRDGSEWAITSHQVTSMQKVSVLWFCFASTAVAYRGYPYFLITQASRGTAPRKSPPQLKQPGSERDKCGSGSCLAQPS